MKVTASRSVVKACLFGGTLIACGLANPAHAQFAFSSSTAYSYAFSNNYGAYSYDFFSGAGFWSINVAAPGVLGTAEATAMQFRMEASTTLPGFVITDPVNAFFTVLSDATATATWDYTDLIYGNWTIRDLTDDLTLLSVVEGTAGSAPITLMAGKSYLIEGAMGLGGDPLSSFAQLTLPNIVTPISVGLDIKPGSCPNNFNVGAGGFMVGAGGFLPVAVLGSSTFDVSFVDVTSVTIARADGVGGELAPNFGRPGPAFSFADVASPYEGEACGCHEGGPDGFVDLMLHFPRSEMAAVLELGGLPSGTLVPLVVTGTTDDGTSITATDCVRIQ